MNPSLLSIISTLSPIELILIVVIVVSIKDIVDLKELTEKTWVYIPIFFYAYLASITHFNYISELVFSLVIAAFYTVMREDVVNQLSGKTVEKAGEIMGSWGKKSLLFKAIIGILVAYNEITSLILSINLTQSLNNSIIFLFTIFIAFSILYILIAIPIYYSRKNSKLIKSAKNNLSK